MAPLTAIHRTTLPPSGTQHALSCCLTPPTSYLAQRPTHRLTGHLVTANKSTLSVYQLVEQDNANEPPTAHLVHLLTRRLPGTIASLNRVRTLATKQDGCDRVLVSFLDAKMSLMEWSESEHDLVPVSLHTFEKLPQVAEDRPHLLAVDPSSRLAVMLLPTNTGGDGTLALLPFFSEELDFDSLGMDRAGWEGAGASSSSQNQRGGAGSIPYAPSHLVPLSSLIPSATGGAAGSAARSSTLSTSSHTGANAFLPGAPTPPLRNVISMAFLPGFTEPTLALLYAPDWTWSGRLEHLAHNYLVSLVTLSSTSASDPASSSSSSSSATRATLISTSPPLPYSCLALSPCPPSLGGVLLTTSNGLLHLDPQSGRVVAAPTNAWLARDYPPGRARPVGLDGEDGRRMAEEVGEGMEGSRVEFLTHAADDDLAAELDAALPSSASAEPTALVWTKRGTVLALSFIRTGRTLAGLKLEKVADGRGVTGGGSSVLARLGNARGGARRGREGYVWVGSEQGGQAVLRWSIGNGGGGAAPVRVEEVKVETAGMELDDDEEIYGSSSAPTPFSLPGLSSSSSSASKPTTAALAGATNGATDDGKLRLEVVDSVEGYGAVREMVMGLVDESGGPAELVAATGAGQSAGLTIFHRTLPFSPSSPSSRKPLYLPTSAAPAAEDQAAGLPGFVPTEGLWRVRMKPVAETGEVEEVWVAGGKEETMIYRPSPSSTSGSSPSLELFTSLPVPTLSCHALLSSRFLLLVSSTSLTLYALSPSPAGPFLEPLHELPFPHGAAHPSQHPPHVSSTDSTVVVHVAQGTGPRAKTRPVVFRAVEVDGGARLEELDGAVTGGEGARAAVYADQDGALPLVRPAPFGAAVSSSSSATGAAAQTLAAAAEAMDEDEDDLYGGAAGAAKEAVKGKGELVEEVKREEEVQTRVVKPEGEEWEWVAEVDAKGDLKIRLLPSLDEIFSAPAATLLPSVLEDEPSSSASSPFRIVPENLDLDDIKLDRVFLAPIGPRGRETLHLFVLLANGTLAVYEAFSSLSAVPPSAPLPTASTEPTSPRLAVRFVKTLVRHLPSIPLRRKGGASSTPEPPPPKRAFTPFSSAAHSGVFITGEEAVWVLKGPHGPACARECAERGVYAFADLGAGAEGRQKEERTMSGREGAEETAEFAVQTRESLTLTALSPALSLSAPLAYTHVPKDRVYAHLAFDLESGLYIAATMNETRFVAFDEEGVPMFRDEAPGLIEPNNFRSTLEVLVPGSWQAITGFEFRQNEFVTALRTVSLSSKASATGQREFVAVGTAVYRGEDLATRGGLYVFELVRINPDPSTPRCDHVLRQIFFEDTKAVVNNLCDLNGYLFLSMGQKLYARALEMDEFLFSVGFLDIGVHVTSLQAMKNFLLIGDERQSVALVAFQEDPYKLVLLGRDYRPSTINNANFLINDGKVAFISHDDSGVLRLFEYDPANIASHAGQRLLCRTEYYAGAEALATILFAKHLPGEDPKQNGILYGGLDGSLSTLVPVRDAVFKRLQALQTLMSRHVLHFGGLNPRGYRIVKNDTVSRALQKGILDGDVLAQFEYLSVDHQTQLAEVCGTDADTVRANLRSLRGWE
ncbi:hypothetical protein JCM8097_006482 [Rhodosporidiobolus ruineniae]